eukprot:SAG25_NODE_1911_length_2153_cov_1.912853_4_plen_172_part_00
MDSRRSGQREQGLGALSHPAEHAQRPSATKQSVSHAEHALMGSVPRHHRRVRGGGGSAGSPRHVIKTIFMKTISRVTEIHLQFHPCYLRFLSCMPESAGIEAPWVPAPATVAGRWRARRLNNACWGGGGSAGSLGSDLSSSAWLSRSLSCLASALRETSRSSRRRLPRTLR